MIELTVHYPNKTGAHFDEHYFINTHLRIVRERLGGAVKGMVVRKGLSGTQPDSAPASLYLVQIAFESIEAFSVAFAPCADEVMNDIPKYTNIEPIMQFSETILSI